MNESKPITATKGELVRAIRSLLAALERQHYGGKPPGQYQYSMAVDDAIAGIRRLLPEPKAAVQSLAPEDEAHLKRDAS